MYKGLLIGFVTLSVVGCSDPETKWLYDGSSIGLDRQEWVKATPERQLGTAGFWLQSLQDKGFLSSKEITTPNATLKQNAKTLTDCVNKVIAYSNDDTNQLAAECVKLNGWMK